MKLAFCLFKYFPYGGLQRDFLQFYHQACQRGHQVRVYCLEWDGPKPDDIDLHFVPQKALTSAGRNKHYAHYIANHLVSNPVDLVVGFNKMPDLDVYYAADSCFQNKAVFERSWLYRLTRRYRHFYEAEANIFKKGSKTKILLISETERKKFLRHYDTEQDRMVMLPPGISLNRKAPDNAAEIRKQVRKEFKISDDHNLLLFIGSGFINKGLDRAIVGLASLEKTTRNKTHFFVIGQDKKKRFSALADKLEVSDRIRFLGGRDDIPRLLLAGDCLIHPALDEAAGIVLLESVVAGLPVLVTDVCGYAHHVDEAKAGIVLKSPFKQQEFNTAMEKMLNKEQQQLWKKNALAYADSQDLYSMHSKGIDVIEEVFEKRKGKTKAREKVPASD